MVSTGSAPKSCRRFAASRARVSRTARYTRFVVMRAAHMFPSLSYESSISAPRKAAVTPSLIWKQKQLVRWEPETMNCSCDRHADQLLVRQHCIYERQLHASINSLDTGVWKIFNFPTFDTPVMWKICKNLEVVVAIRTDWVIYIKMNTNEFAAMMEGPKDRRHDKLLT